MIWSGAALADFVVNQRIGVTIDRLEELEILADRVDNDSYLSMVDRVRALRGKVGPGGFLSNAAGRLARD